MPKCPLYIFHLFTNEYFFYIGKAALLFLACFTTPGESQHEFHCESKDGDKDSLDCAHVMFSYRGLRILRPVYDIPLQRSD